MKKISLSAGLVTLLWIGSAAAADMAVKTAPVAPRPACAAAQWDGFYVGINGGAAQHNAYRQEFGDILPTGADEGNTVSSWGSAVGGQAGYNFVNCNTFWGIEVDGSWLSNNRFQPTDPLSSDTVGGISSRLDGVVTARVRAGVALDNMLIYVTGGAAALHTRTIYSRDDFGGGGSISETATVNDWSWGWVAGVGAEWAFTQNLSVRTEFLYIGTADRQFNRNSVGFDTSGGPFSNPEAFTQHDNVAIARVGLNYRFSGPVVRPVS